jgi:hypothetical protein
VLRGLNAVGKSTIEQAISLMLAGRSESTDDRGSGAKDLIRKGEDKALVGAQLVLDGQERQLRMSLTEKSGRTLTAKNPKDESWSGSELIDYLKINRDVLTCLCNGRFFIDMDEAQQKNFLAGIVLPQSHSWDATMIAPCATLGINVNWAAPPFEVIDEAYQLAYRQRTVVNGALKVWTLPEKPAATTLSVADIRSKLAERQKQRTELAVERERLLGDYERQKKGAERMAKRRTDSEAKRNFAEQAKTIATQNVLTEKRLDALKKVAEHEAQAKLLDAKVLSITASQVTNEDRIAKLMDPDAKGSRRQT